jgi:hypothetical protein
MRGRLASVKHLLEWLGDEANRETVVLALGVVSTLVGAAWVAYVYFRPLASVKRQMDFVASAQGAGLEVTDRSRRDLARRYKNVQDPYPQMIGFPHLFTVGVSAFWIRFALDPAVSWWIRIPLGLCALLILGLVAADIVWSYSPLFRYSKIGLAFGGRFKLFGESATRTPARRVDLVLRDERWGLLPAHVTVNDPAELAVLSPSQTPLRHALEPRDQVIEDPVDLADLKERIETKLASRDRYRDRATLLELYPVLVTTIYEVALGAVQSTDRHFRPSKSGRIDWPTWSIRYRLGFSHKISPEISFEAKFIARAIGNQLVISVESGDGEEELSRVPFESNPDLSDLKARVISLYRSGIYRST